MNRASRARGVHYWDYTNAKLYVNTSGSTSWTEVGAGGSAGGAQMLLQWAEDSPQTTEGPSKPRKVGPILNESTWNISATFEFPAPSAGTIVAVFVGNDEQVVTTAGTYKVEVYKNNSATGLSATMDSSTNTKAALATGSISFVSVDLLVVKFTTASFAPTNANQYMGMIVDFGGGASSHAFLSTTHSDTLASAVSRGSLIVGNATPKYSELVVGSAAQYLRSNGVDAAWTAVLDGDLPASIARDSELHTKYTDPEARTAVPYVVTISFGWDPQSPQVFAP